MSLLPKTFQDFSSKQYWNTFFTRRGEKAFEWYGEYTELCGLLHKYIRPNDEVLVAGCGNSTLSGDLYKVGYRNLTNIDNSEVVIRQMRDKHRNDCPDMKWLKMDLSAMEFSDGSFSCVLDKAALDAIMTDDSEDVAAFVDKYLSEVQRVLRVGGRFVCVSLLQEHILKHILHWFTTHGWMLRVCRCEDAEKSQSDAGTFQFPVFFVVCTKFKPMPNFKPVVEVQLGGEVGGEVQRVANVADVVEKVMELQQYAFLRHNMHTKSLAGEGVSVQLCDAATGSVRYTLHVVDSKELRKTKFAVFIVPRGREREWLFGSVGGREQLGESAGVSRLLVAVVHHSAGTPTTLQGIQDELSPRVMELAPSRLPPGTKVPFLSVGEELGEVKEVARGHSDHSGDYVVEDLHPPGAPPIRRLVFLGNQAVVQSEARILVGKTKEDKNKKKKKKVRGGGGGGGGRIDHTFLSCHHHLAMLSGVALAPPAPPVLVVGLGGGALASALHHSFPQQVVAVELDKAMVEVASKWFDFKVDERMKVEVCDGLDYISRAAQEGLKFGAILFDVDSKDTSVGLSCPPAAFLQHSFLLDVARCLTKDGLLIVNLVCRDSELRTQVLADLKAIFPSILLQDIPEEVNCILHCLQEPLRDAGALKERFKGRVKSVSDRFCRSYDKEMSELADMMNGVCVL